MKKFIIYVSGLIVFIFGVMAAVNYYVDPSYVFHNKIVYQMVDILSEGKNVIGPDNMNERLFKKEFIKRHKDEHFDYVVFGSSRAFMISSETLNGAKVLNLAVSGCAIEDIAGLYEICEQYGVTWDTAIVSIDPPFFNGDGIDKRHRELVEYYAPIFGLSNAKELVLENKKEKLYNLISPSYFQSSLAALPSRIKYKEFDVMVVDSYKNTRTTYLPDGSLYYGSSFADVTPDEAAKKVSNWNHSSYKGFNEFSDERMAKFEVIVDSIKNKSQLVFYCAPYHPSYWPIFIKTCPGGGRAIHYITDYANINHIQIIGSIQPNDCGAERKDFYDAVHVRKEKVDELFFESNLN